MQYIEYLTTDAKCWFDTGIIPDFNTKIEVSIIPLSWSSADIPEKNWNGFIGAQNNDDAPSTFQIRNYNNQTQWSARVGNGNGNVRANYTRGTQYTLTLDKDYFTVDGRQYGTGASSMDTCNYSLFISAINNSETSSAWALRRAAAATFYYVKVWKNDVLVGEFLPAINNGSIGFYDTVSQSFKANLGTGTPVAGPILSSIIVEASKTTLAAAGDTSNITITCDNAWAVSGNTFLTLSSTGDTGSTAITATAPSYSGATARTDTLTFTDSVTGDEVEVSIKQKKYTSGQPFYLGADEIAEIYLGADSIAEAYLGEDLVFSSSPSPSPAPIGDKTLTISNMATINGDVETKQITIDGNMSVSVENDSTQETFSPVSTAGYTSSYSNGTITISGPFGNTASLAFYYSTNTAPCLQTNQAETVTFVNNAASTAFDDSALYTNQECDCYQQGGTWEDGGCTYPEPEDPCVADPCMCDPNPDECYCIQQGGTWDGSQCIMPE